MKNRFQLSKKESDCFGMLAAREAAGIITKDEHRELTRLDRKRSKLWMRSPAGRDYMKAHRKWMRRFAKMEKKIAALMK